MCIKRVQLVKYIERWCRIDLFDGFIYVVIIYFRFVGWNRICMGWGMVVQLQSLVFGYQESFMTCTGFNKCKSSNHSSGFAAIHRCFIYFMAMTWQLHAITKGFTGFPLPGCVVFPPLAALPWRAWRLCRHRRWTWWPDSAGDSCQIPGAALLADRCNDGSVFFFWSHISLW